MYEQIAANKRKTVLLIFVFVLLLSSVGVAFDYLAAGRRSIGFVIVAVIVIGRRRSSRTSTATRSRCAMAHAEPADP